LYICTYQTAVFYPVKVFINNNNCQKLMERNDGSILVVGLDCIGCYMTIVFFCSVFVWKVLAIMIWGYCRGKWGWKTYCMYTYFWWSNFIL